MNPEMCPVPTSFFNKKYINTEKKKEKKMGHQEVVLS